nr:hypothetical protein GCM10020241_16300 [Streptoalloteichus tenebrarius]
MRRPGSSNPEERLSPSSRLRTVGSAAAGWTTQRRIDEIGGAAPTATAGAPAEIADVVLHGGFPSGVGLLGGVRVARRSTARPVPRRKERAALTSTRGGGWEHRTVRTRSGRPPNDANDDASGTAPAGHRVRGRTGRVVPQVVPSGRTEARTAGRT